MKKIVALLSLAGILFGCAPKQDETAFLVINGKPLTAERVRQAVLTQAKMAELAGQPVKSEQFAAWANATAMRLVGPMASGQMLDEEAVRKKVAPTAGDYALVLTNLCQACGQNPMTIEKLAAKFGDQKDELLAQYERSARLIAYSRVYWETKISDEEIRAYFNLKKKEAAQAAEIDEKARQKAAAAYRRLENGEKWDLVAAQCSEDRLLNPGNERMAKEWCWMGSEAMGLTELAAALPKTKVGGYTQPLETKAGMLIVKVLEKKGLLYRVARILFRMSVPVNVPADEKKAQLELKAKRLSSRQSMTMRKLEREARIEYPLGTNFVYKIWK